MRLWTKRFVEVTTRAVWTDGAVYVSVVGSYLRGDRGNQGGPNLAENGRRVGNQMCLNDTCLRMTEAALQREREVVC